MDSICNAINELQNHRHFRRTPEPWFLMPKQYIYGAALANRRVEVLTYWGISSKPKPDRLEADAWEYLNKRVRSVSDALGLEYAIDVILTDSHAAVNAIPEDAMYEYANQLPEILSGARSIINVSKLLGYSSCKDMLEHHRKLGADMDCLASLPKAVSKMLVSQASRHSLRNTPMDAANDYVRTSMLESPIVRQKYSAHLQVTYQPPELMWLLPALPTVFTYVNESHYLRRPWFNIAGKDV